MRDRLTAWLFKPIDIAYLVYFRIAFGFLMTCYSVYKITGGGARELYVRPDYFFPHLGFAWVPILPDTAMYALFAVMSLCSVLITLGLFYRLSSVVFALLMTYTFVIDKAHYLNHHYLMCLLSWCMALLPANRAFALDCVQHPDLRASTIPAWTLWLLRFHIAVPYFFGGIAKFDADWLSGRPMELTLSRSDWHPLLGPWTDSVALIQFFTWGGLLFDLLVVPGLLWKPTRGFAFAMCLLFHLTNSSVFTIGVFPWLMIAATALFFPPDWPRRLFARRLRIPAPPSPLKWSQLSRRARAGLMLATVYVAFHCLFPLRHLLLDREANWTERGHFFAWHMLLREKRCGLRVYAVDRETREVSVVDARPYVTRLQLSRVSRDPEMIRQLAHHIHRDLQQSTGKDVEIRVLSLVSLNGRRPQLLIDPTVDLSREAWSWSIPAWIMPLSEPLGDGPWDVPLTLWEEALGIDPIALLQVPQASPAPQNGPAEVSSGVRVTLGP